MALQWDSNIIWEASQISPNLDGERLGRTQQHKSYFQLQDRFHASIQTWLRALAAKAFCR